MDLSRIPLFAMLRGRLGYLTERQRLIAENVANSDTPGFAPKDLKPFSFSVQQAGQLAAATAGPAVTRPGHMQAPHARAGSKVRYSSQVEKDSETRLDGNSVVLEEQMNKLTNARMEYDAAISFYQKSLNLLRMAAKAPGK
jgi:flagellar basal-body rod protein FlgB